MPAVMPEPATNAALDPSVRLGALNITRRGSAGAAQPASVALTLTSASAVPVAVSSSGLGSNWSRLRNCFLSGPVHVGFDYRGKS